MPKQRHFFATPNDLKEALTFVEKQRDFQFVNGLLSRSDDVIARESLAVWPSIGVCRHSRPTGGGLFLVLPKETEIGFKKVGKEGGEIVLKADVAHNPTAFVFEPGGVFISPEYGERLVVGRITTTNVISKIADENFDMFSSAFLREFKRAGNAYYGREANSWITDGVQVSW